MNVVGCVLSMQALQHLLRLIQETKSRKRKAFMVLRSSKGRRKRFVVENRARNGNRNRWLILQKIHRMSDSFFKKYFRMDRPSFKILLDKILHCVSPTKYNQCKLRIIHPSIKLAVALRFLAGGSYLDLSFAFDIPDNTVMGYVWEVFEAIDDNLHNIVFPIEDEVKLRELEQGIRLQT